MKNLLRLLTLIIILTSCGRNAHIVEDHDDRFTRIENRIGFLEQQMLVVLSKIDDVSYKLTQLDTDLNSKITDVYNTLVDRINIGDVTVSNQVQNLSNIIDDVRNDSITIIDPCDNNDFSQEIILKSGSGELIAVYHKGNQSYLASLSDGIYVTTDSRRCRFEILNEQVL